MSILLHIGNASGDLNHVEQIIKNSAKQAFEYAEENFDAKNIDVFVINSSFYAIPELGFGGFCPAKDTVYINVDCTKKELEKKLLTSTFIHELHHAMRWRDPGYGETLGEALVTEGLACLAEQEFIGAIPMYSKVKLSKDIYVDAKKEASSKTYDHDGWFFGYSKTIPRWAGYTVGYEICKKYSNENNKTASQMLKIDAKEILSFL